MRNNSFLSLLFLSFIFANLSYSQVFSTDPKNPTPTTSRTISGEILPTKETNRKKHYVTFVAGPDKFFLDVKISPKENKVAVFFWQVFRLG
ncbi:MAG: hypothetical protein N2Z23_09410 [Pyrinomonadaceae bacterium]|nr:hypothetical protein [Pyrinomonadaceae bacterium]MCX7640640.1 hypothetical protein [Pyrinomonadaceae bacterium]MDW8305341.1 hypothetical protein [Acidobacteriota bacterium]